MKMNPIKIIAVLSMFILTLSSCSNNSSYDITGKTFNSRFVYIDFQKDGKVSIYQKSSPDKYVGGCAAEGNWQQKNNKITITVTQSFCPGENYSDVNGTFTLKDNCIENSSHSFCRHIRN
jgi:hypothetical protein